MQAFKNYPYHAPEYFFKRLEILGELDTIKMNPLKRIQELKLNTLWWIRQCYCVTNGLKIQ